MLAALLLFASVMRAQAPAAGPKFEVASVKPSADPFPLIAAGIMPRQITIDPSRVEMSFVSLETLIARAYRIEPYRMVGPEWMATARFDIVATLRQGAAMEQVPQMLQALLAERFALAVHRESRERAVYALQVGKDGPRMDETPSDAAAPDVPFPNGLGGRSIAYKGGAPGQWWTYSRLNGGWVFDAQRIDMAEFALRLMAYVDLPVLDETGLKGAYRIVLLPVPGGPNYKHEASRAGTPEDASTPSGVSIFRSVEKLGLRLERARAPVEYLVVDHLERTSTPN